VIGLADSAERLGLSLICPLPLAPSHSARCAELCLGAQDIPGLGSTAQHAKRADLLLLLPPKPGRASVIA
jgi:hypothetical protein